jgi:hypothetical protein
MSRCTAKINIQIKMHCQEQGQAAMAVRTFCGARKGERCDAFELPEPLGGEATLYAYAALTTSQKGCMPEHH